MSPPSFIPSNILLDGNWIAGFVSADGSFGVSLHKTTLSSVGYYVKPKFEISQHKRDLAVFHRIQSVIGGTSTIIGEFNDCHRLQYHKRSILLTIVIPFFSQYPLHGTKALDFKDFTTILMLIDSGAHLTLEGIDRIRTIISGMNSTRLIES